MARINLRGDRFRITALRGPDGDPRTWKGYAITVSRDLRHVCIDAPVGLTAGTLNAVPWAQALRAVDSSLAGERLDEVIKGTERPRTPATGRAEKTAQRHRLVADAYRRALDLGAPVGPAVAAVTGRSERQAWLLIKQARAAGTLGAHALEADLAAQRRDEGATA